MNKKIKFLLKKNLKRDLFVLFLKPEIDDAAAKNLVAKLMDNQNIKTVKLIDREQALAEYKELSGYSDVIDLLDENPLPSIILFEIPPFFISRISDFRGIK